MAIFASTTTSGYSDPLKAYSIKALEQRMKDQQAQMAAEKPDAAMMATIPGGIGHVLGQLSSGMQQARGEQALAANRDALAKVRAGMDLENPTAQNIADLGRYDPDAAKEALQMWAENRRHAATIASQNRGQDVTARGQDVGANVNYRGQDITARGQDVGANTAAANTAAVVRGQDVGAQTAQRGQDITARGQDITARGQDIQQGTAVRGQDITARGQDMTQDTAVRGQDTVAGTAARGQDITARGQDIQQDTAIRGQDTVAGTAARGQDITARGQDMTQDSAVRGQDVTVRGQDMTQATTERGQDLANRVKMDDLTKGTGIQSDYARHAQSLDNLNEARELLNKGINHGFWGSAQTKAAQIADGRWGTDKDAADRTTRFNQLVNEQAINRMTTELKGQSTNFEMDEFKKILNDPNVSPEDRMRALDRLINKATVDRASHANAARAAQKQIGGPTVEEIDETLAKSRGGGAAAAGGTGGVVTGITEEEATRLPPNTKFKLKDGRTGVTEP